MRKANRSSAPRNIAANNVHPTSATPGTPKESAINSPTDRPGFAAAQTMSRKRRAQEPTLISLSSTQNSTQRVLDSVLLGDPEPPCPKTRGARKWIARDVRALIPEHADPKMRDHFADAMEWLMRCSLDNTFLTPMKMTISNAWADLIFKLDAINIRNDELIRRRFNKVDLNAAELGQLKLRVEALGPIPRPSLSTMYRRKNAIPHYDIVKAQMGKKFADTEYRVSFPGTKSPRSPVRIDGDETKNGPPRISGVDITFGNTLERRVLHYGIEVGSLTYQSHELGELRRRLARPNAKHPRVVLKITSGDRSSIYVLDPQAKTYLMVPAVNQE